MRSILAFTLALTAATILPADAARQQKAVAKLINLSGAPAGTATFTATRHGILVDVKVTGMTPGPHAVHVHTAGSCDPKTQFTSAGPHFSPQPKAHGFNAKGGMHAGDLPNAYAGPDGTLQAQFLTNAFALGNGKKSVFDKDGASIVVHAKGDDYMSQPAGAAGDRVACGVIVRTVGPASRGKYGKRKH